MPQHRAVEWLHEYGRRFPKAWDIYAIIQDEHRQARPYEDIVLGGGQLTDMHWPTWCWCPLAGAHTIVAHEERRLGHMGPMIGVGELGAVAAWRATQGIYRIDPDLFEELYKTPITGKIPVDVVKRLPEWCCYIECTSPLAFNGLDVQGFFVHLDYVPVGANVPEHAGQTHIRFAISCAELEYLVPLLLVLEEGGTLETSLDATAKHISRNYTLAEARSEEERDRIESQKKYWAGDEFRKAGHLDTLGSLLSVALYLCAEETDVPRPATRPLSVLTNKKGGKYLPLPKRPLVHECGYKLGAELRWAREYNEKKYPSASTGRTVLPHVRAAHWHTFLTGPRAETRIPKVKWLPPILVNTEGYPEVATLRVVK